MPDGGGVFLVPAFAGLGSPWWDPYARGTIVGLTRGSGRAELARATVEAMALQTRDVVEAMSTAAGVAVKALRVDGGTAVMDLLLQIQADQLGVPVTRPVQTETTDGGVRWPGSVRACSPASTSWRATGNPRRRSPPSVTGTAGPALFRSWRRAVERSRRWVEASSTDGPAGKTDG